MRWTTRFGSMYGGNGHATFSVKCSVTIRFLKFFDTMNSRWDLLLSLPPNMCRQLQHCHPAVADRAFVTHDPPDAQLGSGGGTAHVMAEAWRASSDDSVSFLDWADQQQRIILHGGGESRRLPAYAGAGNCLFRCQCCGGPAGSGWGKRCWN